MKNYTADRIPTLAECIDEWKQKQPLMEELKDLEEQRIQLECRVKTLRVAEATLRQDVIRLSHTLSRLYDMAGKLANTDEN